MERLLSISWQRQIEELSDLKLCQKAMKGNSEAYAELIKRHKGYFYRMAYTYVKNEQLALDLVEEMTYLGLLKIHQLKTAQYFKTVLCQIVLLINL